MIGTNGWRGLCTINRELPVVSLSSQFKINQGEPLTGESERSSKMKRNLLVSAVMAVAILIFTPHHTGAQCPEDPNDLGICDTMYVETFDCDHEYEAEPGSFDSVRVAIYVTHDSNTFWWEGAGRWAQDSIMSFVIPLNFWHEPEGCADSVILPNWDNWNNTIMNPSDPRMSRSMFRHIVDTHSGDTTYNRMLQMVENGKMAWFVCTDFESHSSDGDSGKCSFSMIPLASTCQRWSEGSRVLLATLTFQVYMSEDCDTTEIWIDSTSWSPYNYLTFPRHDALIYYPRHFLPVKDTIYIPPLLCGDCNGDGVINSADVVYLINYLFKGGSAPDPVCIGDVNCDGVVNSADVVSLINYLFKGGPLPCPDCCKLKAKREEFPGQKFERDFPQIRPVPQKLPKAPGDLKRIE